MEKKRDYWTLLAALTVIALTSFTVQSILSEQNQVKFAVPELGSTQEPAEQDAGIDGAVRSILAWVEEG
ncbi:hypothetical protein HYX10_02300 [Candidatus Woesearchaeota archaeon]|nr:hypothetical protein [Candidatus Woesearchaeota archaeon]